jgi:preprotein translocase subunit SecB
MFSKFQLDRYVLDAITVEANTKLNREIKEHVANIETNVAVVANEKDARRYVVKMAINIVPQEGKEAEFVAYAVKVRGRAFFVFEKPPAKEDADHVLGLNGAAMLYGLLRGQVAQLTAQGPHRQMLLPTLSFFEIQKRSANKPEPVEAAKPAAPKRGLKVKPVPASR